MYVCGDNKVTFIENDGNSIVSNNEHKNQEGVKNGRRANYSIQLATGNNM